MTSPDGERDEKSNALPSRTTPTTTPTPNIRSSTRIGRDTIFKFLRKLKPAKINVPPSLQWIPANWTWSRIKPVIRCAVAAWICTVLFLIPRVEIFMGQASFLILIASFLSPPSDPFMSVLEREAIILVFVLIGWGWASLGIKLADLARHTKDSAASLQDIFSGQYVEAAPTVIQAAFIFFGISPSPQIGQAIILPLAFHSGVALLCSILIFPVSISAQFTQNLTNVLRPLQTSLALHRSLLETSSSSQANLHPTDSNSPTTPSSDSTSQTQSQPRPPSASTLTSTLKQTVSSSESGLIPLAASARLLRSDLIYTRFAPLDWRNVQKVARRIAVRANGMAVYWELVDPEKSRFNASGMASGVASGMATPMRGAGGGSVPGTPIVPSTSLPADNPNPLAQRMSRPPSRSRHGSRPGSRHGSRAPSVIRGGTAEDGDEPGTPTLSTITQYPQTQSQAHSHSHANLLGHFHRHPHLHSIHLHSALKRLSISHPPNSPHSPHNHHHQPSTEFAVGVFESQRYLNLEARRLHDPLEEEHTREANVLLKDCCGDMVGVCEEGIKEIVDWLGRARDGRLRWTGWGEAGKEKQGEMWADGCEKLRSVRDKVARELEAFMEKKRHKVLDPYRLAFEQKDFPGSKSRFDLEFEEDKDEREHQTVPPHRYLFRCYVYQYHLLQFSHNLLQMFDEILKMEAERRRNKLWTPAHSIIFSWRNWEAVENLEKDDDENPEMIPGIQPTWSADLGEPMPRDPDALPPRNAFELVMNGLYRLALAMGHGNMVFAIKAAILTGTPTASLQRTVANNTAREVIMCLPSFIKASSGFAYRNRFVWAIFMGQLTLARFRGDTTFGLTARILATFFGCIAGLIMWYISAGTGHANAYGLGAVCAVCFPFFFYARLYWPGPPMTNIIFFVTTVLVVGYSYQDNYIVVAASPGSGWDVAWRRFLLVTVGVSAAFLFSFFPPSTTIRSYQRTTLATTAAELGAIYCAIISFANAPKDDENQSIITSLIAVRSKLKRSIVLKANVVYERTGAELETNVGMISTALKTGHPLPQITPCPLLDRYMERNHGLNVIHVDSEEDYGLPRTLTLSTLENEQYLRFCVGASTAYSIMTQLDRLMVATKEIVAVHKRRHMFSIINLISASGMQERAQTHHVQEMPRVEIEDTRTYVPPEQSLRYKREIPIELVHHIIAYCDSGSRGQSPALAACALSLALDARRPPPRPHAIINMETANLSESHEWVEGCINNLPSPTLLEELRVKFKYNHEEYPRLPEYERLSDFLSALRSRGALRRISVAIHLTLRDDADEDESALARKSMFLPVAYVALYATMTADLSLGDYVAAGAFTAQVFTIFDLLLLTDAHRELRLVDQVPPSAGSLPLFARAKWALCLLTSPRLIGWANEPKNGSIPPRPTDTSRIRFAARQIVYIAFHLLTLKVLSATMTWHVSRNGLVLMRMGWGWRLADTLQYGATTSTWLSVAHRVWTLALLCTGRRTYHQMLRRMLTSHGRFVTDKILHLPREAKLVRRYTQLYVAFFISGVLHHWAEYMVIHNLGGGSLRFFLSQALAIHCEDIVIYAGGRMGLKQSRAWKVVGYIWVWHWFTWCVPSSLDPLVRLGIFEQLGVNVKM
ncbi:hypothetical protein EYR36_011457 [Pleurotus pulmonarius]|nr:hypothetical protein EYR36_011457 [Pleurotus pulmonarius]